MTDSRIEKLVTYYHRLNPFADFDDNKASAIELLEDCERAGLLVLDGDRYEGIEL